MPAFAGHNGSMWYPGGIYFGIMSIEDRDRRGACSTYICGSCLSTTSHFAPGAGACYRYLRFIWIGRLIVDWCSHEANYELGRHSLIMKSKPGSQFAPGFHQYYMSCMLSQYKYVYSFLFHQSVLITATTASSTAPIFLPQIR